ncbi:MAG TPA: hypothetical protein VG165_07110 [Solirubrobacteraceae bacterium]|jgi:hypothetical protein|nr:hypothetical protein [Solirubrobacteraceae bacterium]
MSDLEAIRRAIGERTAELQRAVEVRRAEIELLTSLLETLDATGRAADPRAPAGVGQRPSAAGQRHRQAVKRQTRAEQAVRLIGENPGITAGELARAMEMNPQYVYRLLPKLAKTGTVVRNRGWGYELARDPGEVEFTGLWSVPPRAASAGSDVARGVGGGDGQAGGLVPDSGADLLSGPAG